MAKVLIVVEIDNIGEATLAHGDLRMMLAQPQNTWKELVNLATKYGSNVRAVAEPLAYRLLSEMNDAGIEAYNAKR